MVRLATWPEAMTDEREFQRRCLIRQICKWGKSAERYFEVVVRVHGQKRADEQRNVARGQFAGGNRGEWGTWID